MADGKELTEGMTDSNVPDRYSRQTRFAPLGQEGQRKLLASRVLICGLGALGTVIANGLARAGVGFLRVIDRDFLELNNLQRQVLYDEGDIASGLPKAEAAARKLRQINSEITIESAVTDLEAANIATLAEDVDLIVDGTDNFETRYLINDFAVKRGSPWVYGGAVGSEGHVMVIRPAVTACLRCLIPTPPAPGTGPTCESAGILGPASAIVANFQVAEAIKLLSGNEKALAEGLLVLDLWSNRIRRINTASLREQSDCPCCVHRRFDWLETESGSHTTSLCGRNAVQICPKEKVAIPWDEMAARWRELGKVDVNRFLLRLKVDDVQVTLFPDGRAIIKGTDDIGQARSLYARYVGS
ncbi:Sulfur carrier protein ThiS adenylyltransferase [Planctomycetes bacterium Pan216]|uniref:Sulfur carrier protein ThiS adenylyltransferase n=1 Tax=Kolteria novifilia TaxID=2527975 RepID=A0A518B188_9BACT|nr:Sulfur carrier protein ThiS adenylyltransferase [Planctomycetes bacterium Pan216]